MVTYKFTSYYNRKYVFIIKGKDYQNCAKKLIKKLSKKYTIEELKKIYPVMMEKI